MTLSRVRTSTQKRHCYANFFVYRAKGAALLSFKQGGKMRHSSRGGGKVVIIRITNVLKRALSTTIINVSEVVFFPF